MVKPAVLLVSVLERCRHSSRSTIQCCSAHFEILGFSMGGAYQYKDIFAWFKTIRRKQNIQQVLLVSKKKIGGNHAFFRDNKASIWETTPYTFLSILLEKRLKVFRAHSRIFPWRSEAIHRI